MPNRKYLPKKSYVNRHALLRHQRKLHLLNDPHQLYNYVGRGRTPFKVSPYRGIPFIETPYALGGAGTPPSSGRKARSNRPLNITVPSFHAQPEPVVDNVPGFDGRAGGGARRRPRKGNGFAKIRAKKRLPKKRKLAAKRRKPKTNKRPRLITSVMKNGVYRSEYNNQDLTSDASNALYVGHSDVVQKDIMKCFFYALVKNVLQRAGVEVKSMNEPPRGIELGDNFTLYYKTSNESGVMNAVTSTVAAVINPMSDYGDAFYAWALALTNEDRVILETFVFTPALAVASTIPRVALPLRNMKITLHLKSELTLRNKTYNNIGDIETDDLDNVPIQGKWYAGKGTGTSYLLDRNSALPLVASGATGLIVKAPSVAENSLIRPIDKRYLDSVKRSGAFMAPAGHTWTSKLSSKLVMPVDKFIKTIQQDNLPDYPHMYYGQFKFYGLEKRIISTAEPVRISVTNRSTIGVGLSFHKPKLTCVTNV